MAQLELDADWVVLSACNTATADGAPDAEALSGFARAFLYAGARALVVSHWPVDSEAAVKLVTGTFAELKRSPSTGRAEALRRAMLAQIKQGGPRIPPTGHRSSSSERVVEEAREARPQDLRPFTCANVAGGSRSSTPPRPGTTLLWC